MFLQDFMAKKRFLHILASFLECKKAIFFKSFPKCHFTVYNAEIFLWAPLTQWHGWLRERSSNQKKVFLGHPIVDVKI